MPDQIKMCDPQGALEIIRWEVICIEDEKQKRLLVTDILVF